MPKYTFKCGSCPLKEQLYVSSLTKRIICGNCGDDMYRQLPTLSGKSDVKETVDSYTGIVHVEDQRALIEQRSDEHYWTIEVPRLVNSGQYSVETMLEMGWIILDEKNQVQINRVPPHRR
jgi:copper chaperone CopZ